MAKGIGNSELRNLILYAMREEMTDVDKTNIRIMVDMVYKQDLDFGMTKEEFLGFMNGGETAISFKMMLYMIQFWKLDNDTRLDYLFGKYEPKAI